MKEDVGGIDILTEELTAFSVGLPSSSINLVFIVWVPSSILVHNNCNAIEHCGLVAGSCCVLIVSKVPRIQSLF